MSTIHGTKATLHLHIQWNSSLHFIIFWFFSCVAIEVRVIGFKIFTVTWQFSLGIVARTRQKSPHGAHQHKSPAIIFTLTTDMINSWKKENYLLSPLAIMRWFPSFVFRRSLTMGPRAFWPRKHSYSLQQKVTITKRLFSERRVPDAGFTLVSSAQASPALKLINQIIKRITYIHTYKQDRIKVSWGLMPR